MDEKVIGEIVQPFGNFYTHLLPPQASDIHNEFMKAIDACNVRFDAAKVILFVLMFALVITLLSAGEPGGHLSERPHPEEGHHAAGHALQVEIKSFFFFPHLQITLFLTISSGISASA